MHGVDSCKAEMTFQRLVEHDVVRHEIPWFRARNDDVGGGLRISSHAAVGGKTVGAQHRSLLDAILKGFPDFVLISLHLASVAFRAGQWRSAQADIPGTSRVPTPPRDDEDRAEREDCRASIPDSP